MNPDDAQGLISERRLSGTIKIRYDVCVPTATESMGPYPLLIVLHGYGGNKRQMMREARLSAPSGFALCSLQGFHQHIREPKETGGPLRYGFGWLTSYEPGESIELHHKALLDMAAALIEEGIADKERVFLLGFSQSCAINYRFAFTYPSLLRGVVGICGGLPGDWETSDRYKSTAASVLHLCGMRDEFYPPSRVRDYLERLGTRASDVEVKSYDAAHEITEEMRSHLRAWLDERSNT
jgi:phospholipase/carboxylesterase